MRRLATLTFAFGALFAFPPLAQCDPYTLSWDNELPYLATAAGLHSLAWIGSRQKSAPQSDAVDHLNRSDIPAFERRFAGNWDVHAQHQSDVLETVGLAAPLLLMSAQPVRAGTIAALYVETLLITSGGVTITKNWVDRSRPYAYGDAAPRSARASQDSTNSFLSGHTAHIAAALSFGATVLDELYPDSASKQWAWPGAVLVTAYEAHLRVRGGKHFPSDTLFGAAWGGWIGHTVPTRHLVGRNAAIIEPALMGDALGIDLKINL
jgi:membrane-associated phospholipid phosphatase